MILFLRGQSREVVAEGSQAFGVPFLKPGDWPKTFSLGNAP